MSGHGGAAQSSDILRKLAILVVLVGAYVVLQRFAVPSVELDSRGLLALGFVILAAYTVGELAEVVKLPHITGYLIAGLVLGPSTAHVIHDAFPHLHLPPPFDEGILNERVKQQLLLLDDLALALIALTAGGELKLEALRQGIRRIVAISATQVALLGTTVTALIWAISGPIPAIALPQLDGLSTPAALALGAVVASISLATSPAATIAVINSSGAKGETTDTVLSVVVLKDVLVVIAFSAATAVATGVLGLTSGEGGFVASLGHIGSSIIVGIVIGGLVHLYLRYVRAELLLFLVSLIFSASFLAHQWHLEAALMFITAGFVTSNFSDLGDELIHEVERLSLPVYVVFFTLAGAKLHLDVLWGMAFFAVTLVAVRMAGLYASTRAGAILGGGGLPLQKYGWMGFVSQAGLAITLANSMTHTYPGAIGEGLFALVLGGVAINEMAGPVMLQWGLTLAGDTRDATAEEPGIEGEQTRAPVASVELDAELDNPWGEPLETRSPAADVAVRDLEAELRLLVKDLQQGPLKQRQAESRAYLGALRREFLRGHRRAMVAAQSDEEGAMADIPGVFRDQIVVLGDGWREQVLDRAARVRAEAWSPAELVGVLDQLAAELPESVRGPVELGSLETRDESWLKRLRRRLLRARMRLGGVEREIDLRALARYHLGGRAPARLEGVAALLINEESRLATRTSELFAQVSHSWEKAADLVERGELERGALVERLGAMRRDLDEDFSAMEEQCSAETEGTRRAALVLGQLMRDLKQDVRTIGTLDLPHRARRYGRVYAERNAGIRALTTDLVGARRTVASRLSAVALDLELVGLEGRIHSEVERQAEHLERDLRGRGPLQLERVDEAFAAWLEVVGPALDATEPEAGALAKLVHAEAEKLEHVVRDALKTAQQLRAELASDEAVGPILRLMLDAARSLTDWYSVPSARVPDGDWSLPPEVPTVEIPFRDLTVAWVEARVARDLANRTWKLSERAVSLVDFLGELDRVIAFNAELAAAEFDVLPQGEPVPVEQLDLVREMLVGAIGRSRTRLKRTTEALSTWPAEGGEAIRGTVSEALTALRGEVLDGGAGDLRSRLFGDRAMGRTLLDRTDEWSDLLALGRARTKAVVLSALGPDRVEALRQGLGLRPKPAVADDLRRVLAEPRSGVELPVVYRRLFSDRALDAGDLIVGRDREMAAVIDALTGDGRLRTAAVIGLKGTGTSSMASAIARAWEGKVRRIEVREPVTAEEVDAWFDDMSADVLTVLTGLRWLYTLAPGGQGPAIRLATRLAQRGAEAPWLITGDLEVWRTISQLTQLDRAAGRVVHLKELSPEDLARAVMARHQMSGYDLVFDASEDVGWQLAHFLLRGSEGEQRQREAWFRTLHEACGGVMQDALRLWLASIREVDVTNGVIRVGAVPRPPVSRLFALDDAVLLLLVQVGRQGWMDAGLHATLFRSDVGSSAVQLTSLCHLGLLVDRGDGRYELARHLRNPVQRALRARGWA